MHPRRLIRAHSYPPQLHHHILPPITSSSPQSASLSVTLLPSPSCAAHPSLPSHLVLAVRDHRHHEIRPYLPPRARRGVTHGASRHHPQGRCSHPVVNTGKGGAQLVHGRLQEARQGERRQGAPRLGAERPLQELQRAHGAAKAVAVPRHNRRL
jgi:hypothetical protein